MEGKALPADILLNLYHDKFATPQEEIAALVVRIVERDGML